MVWQAAALAHEVELNEARLRHSTALSSLEEKLALAQAEARRCRSLARGHRHRRRLPVLSVGRRSKPRWLGAAALTQCYSSGESVAVRSCAEKERRAAEEATKLKARHAL